LSLSFFVGGGVLLISFDAGRRGLRVDSATAG